VKQLKIPDFDPRFTKLAKVLIEHSINLHEGDKLVLSASDFTCEALIHECYRLALQKGALVYLDIFGTNFEIGRADYGGFYQTFMTHAHEFNLITPPSITKSIVDWGDKFIRLTAIHDKQFLNTIDPKKLMQWQKTYFPIFDEMLKKDWILTYLPTKALADSSQMTLEQFTDFYFAACLVDYQQMDQEISALEKIMDQGKIIKILGNNVDLEIGITGRLSEGQNSGKNNIPDGECFIAPVENAINGYIKFEYPQIYQGKEITDIYLELKAGKVINFSASKNQTLLKEIFNQDPDNRRFGELGIGMNRKITKYIKDILFDEKIYGTFHLALGRSYTEVRGGGKNQGTIHWDLIKEMRNQDSSITIDGKVIFKKGQIKI